MLLDRHARGARPPAHDEVGHFQPPPPTPTTASHPLPPIHPLPSLQETKSTAAKHAGELMKTLDASYLRQQQGQEGAEFKQVLPVGAPTGFAVQHVGVSKNGWTDEARPYAAGWPWQGHARRRPARLHACTPARAPPPPLPPLHPRSCLRPLLWCRWPPTLPARRSRLRWVVPTLHLHLPVLHPRPGPPPARSTMGRRRRRRGTARRAAAARAGRGRRRRSGATKRRATAAAPARRRPRWRRPPSLRR